MPAQTQAWMANLANPDFPLTELNKVIYSNSGSPKGSELLNMLENNKVTVPRAVWFVRVLGALDTVCTSLCESIFQPFNLIRTLYSNVE